MQNSLLSTVMKKISAASAKHDVAALEKLTRIAKRVQELESTRSAIAEELKTFEEALSGDTTGSSESVVSASELLEKNLIRVVVDWPTAGIKRDKVVIQERKGSLTLVSFLAEIHSALGDGALEKISSLRISRGPLISRNPDGDFINKGSGTIYAHHRIPRTQYFVITHNGTAEKIDAIHSVAKLLNLHDAVRAQRT